ncbi:hypothetical protein L2E82_18326 [Cichorium intybus]|uniref:Uncharacterized protein n=1 Tax=Cichorium intybus TaxID=13427 RepID=A0ACB9F9S1_CICIN|nr:hypothetical protein L2E82_18326 [Cichorium intybus]
MEREERLMLKEALLELEVESIRNQLTILRHYKSEHKKELSSPSSSMSQEENVNVQKNIKQQEVNVLLPLKRKETSNPEQTAPEEIFVEEKFSTIDGKNLSHYNFYKNANSLQVHEAFQLGLIGICKQEAYLPSKAMEEKLERADILRLEKSRIETFINKVFSLSADDKIFVNGYDAK